MLKKLFSLIYFLFSIFLLLSIFVDRSILEIGIILLVIGLFVFLFIKKRRNIEIDNKLINVLIVLGVILRLCLLFFNDGNLYSDYANFFYCAKGFMESGTINKYVATFPHLITYIVNLGMFFKVFGVSLRSVILFNVIFDLLSAFFIKKLFNSKKAALVWLLNPINIIWCSICHPVVITNTFLIFSILMFKNVIKYFNDKNIKLYIMIVLFGLVLSIANLYRPIMIILFIAMLIYFGLNLTKKNLKKTLLIILLAGISYFGCNNIFTFLQKEYLNDSIATTIGWNIYVGAYYPTNGSWNTTQQVDFDNIFNTDATPNEIQEYFFDKGISLYRSNGIICNLKLFVRKAIVLVKDPDRLSASVFTDIHSLGDVVWKVTRCLTLVTYCLLLLFNLLISYITLKNKNCDFTTLLQLFIIGIVTSHLFVEVAPRYSLPLLVPYTLLIIVNKKSIFEIIGKLKK